MNTTVENNKLIAEFIGLDKVKCVMHESGKYYEYRANSAFSCIKEQEIQVESEHGIGLVEQDFLFAEDLKFHSDWNWLMEVVEKIESLGYQVVIEKNNCNIVNWEYTQVIDPKFYSRVVRSATKIEAVYSAVVEFINSAQKEN